MDKCTVCTNDPCTCDPQVKALNERIEEMTAQAKSLTEKLSEGTTDSEGMDKIRETIDGMKSQVDELTAAKAKLEDAAKRDELEAQVKSLSENIEKLGEIRTAPRIQFPTSNKRLGNLDAEHKGWLEIMKGNIGVRDGRVCQGTKALDTATATSGAEWIATGVVPGLVEAVYLQANLADKLTRCIMKNGSDDVLVQTGDPTMYMVSESTTDASPNSATASNLATTKATLTSKKVMGLTYVTGEADEDELVPAIDAVKASHARGIARGFDDMLINGDTTATHMDSDVTASTDIRKAWKGLRKLALAASLTSDQSTMTPASILAIKTKLKAYGFENVLWLLGPTGNDAIIGESVVSDQAGFAKFMTVEGGKLVGLYGAPVAVTDKCRENLNASGVYDGTTTTKGSILCVNTARHLVGIRRDITINLDPEPIYDRTAVVSSTRVAYAPAVTPSATESSVALGYNF